jgi:hypothetical protein
MSGTIAYRDVGKGREQERKLCREDPVVIRKILAHLDQNVSLQQVACLPESRAPPAMGLLV